MIKIYRSDETNFGSFGLGTIAPISCIAKEELNGMFELELEHPLDDFGKHTRIENERIVKVGTPRGEQLFRIYKTVKTLKSIKAYAHHISYDLLDNYISNPIQLYNATADQILNAIKSGLMLPMPFDFETNLAGTVQAFSVNGCNPMKAILSEDEDQDSVYKLFGGELLRDNFTVKMLKNSGADRGVQIRYGKNLIGLSVDEDYSEIINRVIPYGKNGLVLPEIYVEADSLTGRVRIARQEFGEAANHEQLRTLAKAFVNAAAIPKINIKADIQLLSKTQEYKDFEILENVHLGDIVTVINTKRAFRKKATVIAYEWDCILQKYKAVELGDFIKDITASISKVDKSISVANAAITESKQVLQAISGKIAIANNFLYIAIDGEDYLTATKVFRFGQNGLEFSMSGQNGTYTTIIDNNGVVR